MTQIFASGQIISGFVLIFFLTLHCTVASAFAVCIVSSEALQYTTDFELASNLQKVFRFPTRADHALWAQA